MWWAPEGGHSREIGLGLYGFFQILIFEKKTSLQHTKVISTVRTNRTDREISFAMGCEEEWGQVRPFGWFERTNTPPAHQTRWMDVWMDDVWTGNTLFHCMPVQRLTTVVSYVLTIQHASAYLRPTECITYLPTFLRKC
jgi:hypothetical protein